jgi:hypothetical protein
LEIPLQGTRSSVRTHTMQADDGRTLGYTDRRRREQGYGRSMHGVTLRLFSRWRCANLSHAARSPAAAGRNE